MTGRKAAPGGLVIRKGEARAPAEPAIRSRTKVPGRRVGASLPTETYVRFKAYVARHGITGEQAIVSAIERFIGEG